MIRSNKSKKPLLQRLGKAKVRENFSPLVELLANNGGVIEITDYGKTAAVLLGYEDYLYLTAHAAAPSKTERKLRGSGTLIGDLEGASEEISREIQDSIARTIAQL